MGGWGIGELNNKANSVQLQLQFSTRTELGKNTPGTKGGPGGRDRTLADFFLHKSSS